MDFFIFLTQGGAVGLGYIALSGRIWNFIRPERATYPSPTHRVGIQINATPFSALKGQHTLAQRIAMGTNKRHPPHFPP